MPIDYHVKGRVERGLCGTCEEAVTITFDSGETELLCADYTIARSAGSEGRRITEPVVRCSEYIERGKASKREMEKIAWVLEFKKGGPTGFGAASSVSFRQPKPKTEEE